MAELIIEEVERVLSETIGVPVEVYSSRSVGGGCINHASKLETSEGVFFMKWNGHCPPDMFLREAEGLNELARAAGDSLVVPRVIAVKEVDRTPGFLVQEYLEPAGFNSADDEKLGRGLAMVHRFENDKFGFFNDNYCGATGQKNSWEKSWPRFFRDNRLAFLLGLIERDRPLPSPEMKVYERLLERIPVLVPAGAKPVLIHGDLWSGNYMNTERGPALIDPASYYANREMEFAIITMFGGFSSRFYDAYNEVNPLEPDWRSRNPLYQLYHILNHYYLFGGGYRQQALSVAKNYI